MDSSWEWAEEEESQCTHEYIRNMYLKGTSAAVAVFGGSAESCANTSTH